MQRRTKCFVGIKVGLALVAVATVGTACYSQPRSKTPEASMPTVPPAEQSMPTVPYWHVWTDENGVSHQKRCELSAFELQSISEGAAPSWIDRQSTASEGCEPDNATTRESRRRVCGCQRCASELQRPCEP